MSVLKRLGNVARGKVLEWQRKEDGPDELLAEEPLRRRPPLRDDDPEDEEPLLRSRPEDPLEGTPARPKKRRL